MYAYLRDSDMSDVAIYGLECWTYALTKAEGQGPGCLGVIQRAYNEAWVKYTASMDAVR